MLASYSYGPFITDTGEFKVENDQCYMEQRIEPNVKTEWKEIDCIRYLKEMHINEEILILIKTFHDLHKSGIITKPAFDEIVNAGMDAMSKKQYSSKETIMSEMREVTVSAQKKFPVKKGN